MQQAEKCPVCKQDWPGDKYVGERAIAAVNRRQSRNVPSSVPPAELDGADEDSMEEE